MRYVILTVKMIQIVGFCRYFVCVAMLLTCTTRPTSVHNVTSSRDTQSSRRARRHSHLLGVDLSMSGRSKQRYGAVCTANQCHNRATCVLDDGAAGGFKCQCVRGFYGVHCDNGYYNEAVISISIEISGLKSAYNSIARII